MSDSFFSPTWYRVSQLKPQIQPHVEVHRHRYRGVTWYVLHDKVTGRVHRFTPATYLLIGKMNGEQTVDELWKAAAIDLGEHAPSQDEVIRLLSRLHSTDLMQSDHASETSELLERLTKHRWSKLGRSFKNPLAITLSLVDPNRLLDKIIGLLRPLGARLFVILWLALVLPAVVLLALHWREWSESLPERTLATENLMLLTLVFPAVKLLHELGHGLTLKAFGGTVHDAGVMLLVFMPVPYLDASASLSFRSKYRRALVGAAGMLVELVLAAIAVYFWLFAELGLVKAVAFDVILIAGFSTLVVNGNPLLRFDGYYILTDLLEIPNLGSRSNNYWSVTLERLLFGVRTRRADSVLPSERPWLLAYAPLAYVYRVIVFVGIALFVATEYLAVGVAIAIWSLFINFIAPIGRVVYHLVTSPTLMDRRGRAIAIATGVCLVVVAVIMLVPAPLSTVSEGILWLPEEAQVRAGTSSFIRRLEVASGAKVEAGDTLFQLFEPSLAAQLLAQQERVAEIETRLRADEVEDRAKAAVTRQELEAERSELRRLSTRADRLVVRSARAGTFVALNPDDAEGRYVQEGAMIGFIVGDEPWIVRAVVRQDYIDLVLHHLRKVHAKIVDRLSETFDASIIREV
ncbi:MAG: putative peptide zinc metalloprotease protein, partial [Chloroflexota bacterium]|nr:putative peptide zinc metalloprotease protein [Chloroflexota bacterium]